MPITMDMFLNNGRAEQAMAEKRYQREKHKTGAYANVVFVIQIFMKETF
jgi:hypothetical protein